MRHFLTALVFLFSAPSFATVDPFDPASCSGKLMSGARALELLEDKYEVALSKSEANGIVTGQSRRRQKMQGAVGPWYTVPNTVQMVPMLFNNYGYLGLRMNVKANPLAGVESWQCSRKDDDFECKRAGAGGPTYSAVLTDSCLRLSYINVSPGGEHQDVFLLNF